jgi:predicted O-linked N-acetylglucosamine transferase (SPINDLY family)
VTTLESLAVCTPVVTLPLHQSVPSLAAGMIQRLQLQSVHESKLIMTSKEDYVDISVELLGFNQRNVSHDMIAIRSEICQRSSVVYNDEASKTDWNNLFKALIRSR